MKQSILLLSSSYVYGSGFLESYTDLLQAFLGKDPGDILFIPYAADKTEWDSYTQKARDYFTRHNIGITGIHTVNKADIFSNYRVIFTGGGNTFLLLHELQSQGLMPGIRNAVRTGQMKYIGSSAGTNVACKTICTTNDMPIVYPKDGFEAINLFPFQINPHYIGPDKNTTHMGETRDQRIAGFHQVNSTPVVGLSEGAYLTMNSNVAETGEIFLGGRPGAKLFLQGKEPVELEPETRYRLTENDVTKA